MKLRPRRQRRRGRIEIIPMIDVMFFLLATFMLASLSLQNLHSFAVNLPRGRAAPMTATRSITLTVTREGEILVDQTAVTLDTLTGALKPRLDLKASYGWNGLGGRVLVRDDQGNVVSEIPGGYSDSLQQVTNLTYPGWTVGLQLGIPIQNRTAKAKSAIADLQLDQGRSTLDQLEQNIAVDVRAAVRALRTTRQQIDSATVASRLAEKNLDAEQKKYQNGLSTSFNVLQVQEQLTEARRAEVTARTAFNTAISNYYRAVGKLLAQEAVQIQK